MNAPRAVFPLAFALALSSAACRGQTAPSTKEDPSEAPASPQANAVPAPLTTLPASTTTNTSPVTSVDAGPPPEMPRPQTSFPTDVALRDGPGYSLVLTIRFPDVPPVARGELNGAAIEAARRKAEPTFAVDLTAQRARVVLRGRESVLPDGTEIRMRSDYYGFLLLGPDPGVHRVLLPGTMRALFNERRMDVAPLTPAELTSGGEGARRLGYRTRKVDAWTRAAKATFEMARVQDAGEGGALLCRLLLDWMSAPPSAPLCGESEVPLHAELRWTPRGAIVIDAVSILRKLDVPAANIATPPPGIRFTSDPLPRERGALFFTAQELAPLRAGNAETSKLVLFNTTDELRIAWVDGVPLGWVAPGGRVEALGLPKTKLSVEWRTWLDDTEKSPPQIVTLPAASETGGADAGAL